MSIQVVTVGTQDFQSIIIEAYKEGYLKAQHDWLAEQAARKEEPHFREIIRGCKELRQYLLYKEYWGGSLSTLSKVAPQLLAEGDRQGHGLIFRRAYIDHAFETGFHFIIPEKK